MNEMEVLQNALQRISELTHQDKVTRAKYCEERGIDDQRGLYYAYVYGTIQAIADYALEKTGHSKGCAD